jgi:hypothetical protein
MSNYAPNFRSVQPIPFGSMTASKGLGQKGGSQPKGRGAFVARINKRRFGCLQAASEAVGQLPEDGQLFHGIMSGKYDLMHLLIILLGSIKSPCQMMRIATLSLSSRNVQEMTSLAANGVVEHIDLLVSHFFQKHNKEIFAELVAEFRKQGHRVAVARSHCKIVTLSIADGRRYVLDGSANLRTNKNLEQFCLTQDAGLHGFYDEWLNQMVTENDCDESGDSEKS